MTTAQPVNTKQAPHRDLNFASLDELEAELDRIERASDAGTLDTTGNWSAGQICAHLATFWRMTFDGFDFKAPLPLRLMVRPFKSKMLGQKPPRGIRLRGKIRVIEPAPEVPLADGLAALRREIARTRAGERMTHASPLFGDLTHEQWLTLHLNHCAMHLGFTRYA
jgi:hypothetical protein